MFEATKKVGPTVVKIAPKVVKTLTPWYLRWIYSVFGDGTKMSTSAVAPTENNTSDSVVCFNKKIRSIHILITILVLLIIIIIGVLIWH